MRCAWINVDVLSPWRRLECKRRRSPSLSHTICFLSVTVETIDALCDAINEFNGGVVLVTHDQRLIEECNCNLWVVEKLGVTEWKEGFDDYKDTILRELEEQVAQEAAARREKLESAALAKAEKLALLAKKVKKKS